MSDTPTTDRATYKAGELHPELLVVKAHIARQLERELAQALDMLEYFSGGKARAAKLCPVCWHDPSRVACHNCPAAKASPT